MKKILFLFCSTLFCSTFLFSQATSIQWQKSLGGTGSDIAYSIQQTSDGEYIISGSTDSNDGNVAGLHLGYDPDGNQTSDFWIVKLGAAGNLQWQKCLGSTGNDSGYFIQQTSDGEYIVAGEANSNDGDVNGWHIGYDGLNWPYFDYWVVKLGGTTDIKDTEKNGINFSIYPNPTTGLFNISSSTGSAFELELCNQFGQILYTKNSIEKTTVLDIKSYAAGVYMITLKVGETVMRSKLIKN